VSPGGGVARPHRGTDIALVEQFPGTRYRFAGVGPLDCIVRVRPGCWCRRLRGVVGTAAPAYPEDESDHEQAEYAADHPRSIRHRLGAIVTRIEYDRRAGLARTEVGVGRRVPGPDRHRRIVTGLRRCQQHHLVSSVSVGGRGSSAALFDVDGHRLARDRPAVVGHESPPGQDIHVTAALGGHRERGVRLRYLHRPRRPGRPERLVVQEESGLDRPVARPHRRRNPSPDPVPAVPARPGAPDTVPVDGHHHRHPGRTGPVDADPAACLHQFPEGTLPGRPERERRADLLDRRGQGGVRAEIAVGVVGYPAHRQFGLARGRRRGAVDEPVAPVRAGRHSCSVGRCLRGVDCDRPPDETGTVARHAPLDHERVPERRPARVRASGDRGGFERRPPDADRRLGHVLAGPVDRLRRGIGIGARGPLDLLVAVDEFEAHPADVGGESLEFPGQLACALYVPLPASLAVLLEFLAELPDALGVVLLLLPGSLERLAAVVVVIVLGFLDHVDVALEDIGVVLVETVAGVVRADVHAVGAVDQCLLHLRREGVPEVLEVTAPLPFLGIAVLDRGLGGVVGSDCRCRCRLSRIADRTTRGHREQRPHHDDHEDGGTRSHLVSVDGRCAER